jgi:hypothetical protein
MRPLVLLTVMVLGLGSSCGGSDDETSPTIVTTETVGTEPVTTAPTNGIDTLEGATTGPVSGATSFSETALLEHIATGRHEGFDRVVFRFRNGVPGYRIEYVQPPLREDGSGNRVEVEGDAFAVVRMEPASGFDLTTAEGELVYTGPRRIPGSGTSVVREVVRTGDFEAVLSWAVGLSDRVDFRVLTLENPARLVVDFRNH